MEDYYLYCNTKTFHLRISFLTSSISPILLFRLLQENLDIPKILVTLFKKIDGQDLSSLSVFQTRKNQHPWGIAGRRLKCRLVGHVDSVTLGHMSPLRFFPILRGQAEGEKKQNTKNKLQFWLHEILCVNGVTFQVNILVICVN